MRQILFAVLAAAALSLLVSTSFAQTDFLIWDPDGNANSGPVIQNTLNGIGFTGTYTTNLTPYVNSLDNYCSIWICLGVFPDAAFPWFTNPEYNDSLVSYLVNHNGKIWMEGGECWFNDPPFTLRTYFNIQSLSGGSGDLATINGIGGTFTQGMFYTYSGDNNFIDHIDPLSTAFTIFENSSPVYGCGVAYDDGGGLYKTVGASFEFGGLEDGAFTKDSLAREIMNFFGCPVTQANYDLVTYQIVNPDWYALPNTPTAPQVTFKNVGLNDANNVDAYVDIGIWSSQRTISVPVGGQVTQAFDSWDPGSPCSQYTMTTYHTWAQDERRGNDTLRQSVTSWDGRWDMYSAWAAQGVDWTDGVIDSVVEWGDAVSYDVSDILGRTGSTQSCNSAILYLKNTADTLYIALDGSFDIDEEDNDYFNFYIEDNHDGAWPASPDSSEGALRIEHHPDPAFPIYYYKPMMSDAPAVEYGISVAAYSSFASGHFQVEWVIPMGPSASWWYDLDASAGDTVGLWLKAYEEGGVPPPPPAEVYAWWPTSSQTGDGVLADMGNLILATQPAIDVTPISIEVPGDSVCPGISEWPAAWVRNVGNTTRTFDVAFLVDGGTEYSDTATVTNLAPSESTLAAFAEWPVPACTPGVIYDLTVITLDPNDIDLSNDTLTGTTYCGDCSLEIHDVGVVDIVWPPDTVYVDSSYTPTAMVDNFGNQFETFWVRCDIPPFYVDSQEVVNFDPNAPAEQVNFAPWVVPSNPDVDYEVCVTTLLSGDQNSANDVMCDTAHSITGISEGRIAVGPLTFALLQNAPNPLRTHTDISYQIAKASRVRLSVYDITGRLVATPVDSEQQPGHYQVRWSGIDISGEPVRNGIYFYRLEAGRFSSTLKLAVVR